MATEIIPEYPLFTESQRQFKRWYFSRFDNVPNEQGVKQWRELTFKNILGLPVLDCILPTGDEFVRALDSIPPTRFAGFRTTPPSLN